MIKEQVAEIIKKAILDYNQDPNPECAFDFYVPSVTKQILNLFKAEIGKLTVIEEEIDKLWEQYEKENPDQGGLDTWDKRLLEAQLQHTKKQLLDLMGKQ